ncbi:DNA polymerase III subunit beta [Amycolatopsis balhimycina DSM 5908]|uniref:DNA polymerase III subunit beta n=1 Tax=Amycolatopsis balhimycina DSM 5908 TaxID=1081091 RepID=A0A428W9B1_AMYBA|nr:DNA polymerase III subunit beta [Amycolatopsis balhimycina]RSM39633.1 DNA polymerase III subunit beta [Amycolatopsis balhimycina DSM 5908]
MDVTAPAHRLSAAVSAASRLLPARAGLRLHADAAGLTVAGSDPDLAVRFDCPATTHTDGSVVVPAAPLAETLKVLDAESVRLVVEGSRLALRLDNARFALPLLPDALAAADPPVRVAEVDGSAFAPALRIVAGTAAKDDPLPLFTGVRVQAAGSRLTLTASDRYRMAVARLPLRTPGALDVLVPAALLSEAARQASGNVGLHLGPGRFGLSWRGGLVATAVLDAGFLSEESIASGATDTTVSVEADALAAAVRRVGVYAEDRRVLTLEVGDAQVLLASARQNTGEAEETLKAEISGGRTSPSFQARYLLDALAAFAGERVTLAIQPGMRACVLRAAEPGEVELTYYLMPMLSR